MKAISTITVMPSTVEEINNYVAKVVSEALSGNYDLIDVARQLKAATEAVAQINEKLKSDIVAEMEKFGKGKHTYRGCDFEIRRRKSYNYASTGDPVHAELKEKIKEREAFLKTLKSTVFDEAAGGVEISPPNVSESEYFILKLK